MGRGIAKSLARPAGNITGMSTTNVDLIQKPLELFKVTLSALLCVGVLVNPADPSRAANLNSAHVAAKRLGVSVHKSILPLAESPGRYWLVVSSPPA